MVKIGKVKKREITVHSRAARRNASPTPKAAVKTPAEETDYKPWLHNAQNAGISKKKGKGKQLTRQQKQRQAKSLELAERNGDKLERKIAASKARARKIDERRADWEEMNGKAVAALEGAGAKPAQAKPNAVDTAGGERKVELDDKMKDAPLAVSEPPHKIAVAVEPPLQTRPIVDATVVDELDEVT